MNVFFIKWVLPRSLFFLFVLFVQAAQAAQPLPDNVPPDLQRDMATINGYFDAVRGRQGAVMTQPEVRPSPARPSAVERDPFQVTPELRSRSERRRATKTLGVVAPELGGGGEPLPPMHVKALMVGGRADFAVLSVEEQQGKFRDMVVRAGDPLQFTDSTLVYVLGISRQGVLLGSGPNADDKVLLK